MLINADLQVLQFRGPTGAYLEPPSGKASFDVLKMAREGLMLPLRATINRARKENRTARKSNVRVRQNGRFRSVDLEVIPLRSLAERCFLVVFADPEKPRRASYATSPDPVEPALPRKGDSDARHAARRIAELEAELSETHDYLQAIREQHEAANEELQASSEEVQSANEELQSVNEELETSKEELESTNEELITVNEEMASRNAELGRLNTDLANIQTSGQLAIVLLGRDLTVRRFSAPAEKLLNLAGTDVGRPFGDIRHNLVLAKREALGPDESPLRVVGLVAAAIDELREQQTEVRTRDGRWYSLRVRPYISADDKVDGAVLVLVDIDDLRRNAQAISAMRDYAEAIIRTARDPLVVLDANLRVDTTNEAFHLKFKVSAAESSGRSIFEVCAGQWNVPQLRHALEEVLPRNSFFDDLEITREFSGLGRRTMLLNARALDDAGEPARILLGIQDVTELLVFQAEARESAAKFKLLFERSPLPMLLFAGDTLRLSDVNDAAVELYGFSRAEFLAMALPDVIAPEARRPAKPGPLPSRLPGDGPSRHRKKSGELIEVEGHSTALELGGKRFVVTSIVDVTHRNQTEAALKDSERLLRFVLDSMPQKVFTADADGAVGYVNPQWIEFTGLGFEQIRHWGWTRAIHPEDVAGSVQAWQRSLDTGERFQFEHRLRRADGHYCWHLTRATPHRDPEGKVLLWIGSATDVHEQSQAASQLQRYADELAQGDLRKDEFLAMLAHELRNPLAPIRTSVHVLQQQSRRDRLQKGDVELAAERIDRQVEVMVRLVDDLLDASRISHGKIALRLARLDVASIVSQAVESASAFARSRSHQVSVSLPSRPVYVEGDRIRLAQVLGNLLSNACKYTERGGTITVSVEEEDGSAVVRVRDSGIGISAEHLPRVFDLFMQVDTSLERTTGGLGIGLALARSLVELHG